MDALIKSLRPKNDSSISDVKPAEARTVDTRPAELDPAEFLAAAVRPDQPRPSRAERQHGAKSPQKAHVQGAKNQ